ncbi:MAG: integrase repeat-containing protein [Patescibacteria group bacterium]|nr:integrase repeat-containing protein [Patescibacteria group bacterium]
MASATARKVTGTVSPYSYQQVRITKILESLRNHGKALMVMASGTGKTITSAFIAKELMGNGTKVLFLCHNNDILNQAKLEYGRVFGDSVNLAVFAGNEKEVGDIIFASFQTMRTWKEAFFHDEFDLVIVDESHHSQADTFRDVIEYFTPKYLLGMTATPDRMDGREIREIFGDEIDPLTLEEAIVQGYVTPITYKLMTVGSLSNLMLRRIFQEVMEEGKRISKKQLNETIFIEKRDQEIAKAIITHPGQGIIFCESILHAEEFAKYLPNAEPFHSLQSPSKNAEILKDFRDGKTFYLLTVDKFNEGIDIPDADLVVFLRSTDSLTIFLQQLGRGLRRSPGKKKVTVLDFVANVDRLEYVKQMLDRIKSVESELGELEQNPLYVKGFGFDFSITEEAVDILQVLQRVQIPFYSTCIEASAASQNLGIESRDEYKKRYKEDPRLPSNPNGFYKTEWQGWTAFLGEEVRDFYPTEAEATVAVLKLRIKTSLEYIKRYKEDPRLPSNPAKTYKTDWRGWPAFLGEEAKVFYPTYAEASVAARNLRFIAKDEYCTLYKKDPRLPSNPQLFYKSDWQGWRSFLGTGFYETLEEASSATQKLGIGMSKEYIKRYKEDPRLPSSPDRVYKSEWQGWRFFLGTNYYETCAEASIAAQNIGIRTCKVYGKRYKKDPRLPSSPSVFYQSEWQGWPAFLGKK